MTNPTFWPLADLRESLAAQFKRESEETLAAFKREQEQASQPSFRPPRLFENFDPEAFLPSLAELTPWSTPKPTRTDTNGHEATRTDMLPSLESLTPWASAAPSMGAPGRPTLGPVQPATTQGAPRPGASPVTGYAPSTSRGAEGVEQWSDLISEAARTYGLPESTIKGLMEIESGGNPTARSVAGAMGLLQVMPFHFGPGEDGMDPRTNIMKGAKVYADALRRYGDPDKAAAAYFGAIDDQGNITSARDATGTDGHRYVRLWRDAASKYGGAPNSSTPAAAPSSPAPAPAASPQQGAGVGGGATLTGDEVTIRDRKTGGTMSVPRGMVGEGPGQYRAADYEVVDGRQGMSAPALSMKVVENPSGIDAPTATDLPPPMEGTTALDRERAAGWTPNQQVRNQPVRGAGSVEEGPEGTFAPDPSLAYRGPLSQQPMVPPQEDDFPGNGMGARETDPAGYSNPGMPLLRPAKRNAVLDTDGLIYRQPLDPATPVRDRWADEPPEAPFLPGDGGVAPVQASPEGPGPSQASVEEDAPYRAAPPQQLPVWNAQGEVIGYRQDEPSPGPRFPQVPEGRIPAPEPTLPADFTPVLPSQPGENRLEDFGVSVPPVDPRRPPPVRAPATSLPEAPGAFQDDQRESAAPEPLPGTPQLPGRVGNRVTHLVETARRSPSQQMDPTDILDIVTQLLPTAVVNEILTRQVSEGEWRRISGSDPLAPFRDAARRYGVELPSAEEVNPDGYPAASIWGGLVTSLVIPDPTDPIVGRVLGTAARGARRVGLPLATGGAAAVAGALQPAESLQERADRALAYGAGGVALGAGARAAAPIVGHTAARAGRALTEEAGRQLLDLTPMPRMAESGGGAIGRGGDLRAQLDAALREFDDLQRRIYEDTNPGSPERRILTARQNEVADRIDELSTAVSRATAPDLPGRIIEGQAAPVRPALPAPAPGAPIDSFGAPEQSLVVRPPVKAGGDVLAHPDYDDPLVALADDITWHRKTIDELRTGQRGPAYAAQWLPVYERELADMERRYAQMLGETELPVEPIPSRPTSRPTSNAPSPADAPGTQMLGSGVVPSPQPGPRGRGQRVPPPEGYAAPGELTQATRQTLPNRQIFEDAKWPINETEGNLGYMPPGGKTQAAIDRRMVVWEQLEPNPRIPPGLKNEDMEAFLDDLARLRNGLLTGDTKPESQVLGSLLAIASVNRGGTSYAKTLRTLSATTGRNAEELAARSGAARDIYYQRGGTGQQQGINMRPEIIWSMIAGDTTDPTMMRMLTAIARPDSFATPLERQRAVAQGIEELYRRLRGGDSPISSSPRIAEVIHGDFANPQSILGYPTKRTDKKTGEVKFVGGGAPWHETEPERIQEMGRIAQALAGQAEAGSPYAGLSGEELRVAAIERLIERSPTGIGPTKSRFTASMSALPEYATLDTRMLRDVFGISPAASNILSVPEYELLSSKLRNLGSDTKYLYGQQWLPWEFLTGEKTTYNSLSGIYDNINRFMGEAEAAAQASGRPIGEVVGELAQREQRLNIELADPVQVEARIGLAFRELTNAPVEAQGSEALIQGLQPGTATKGELEKAFPELFKIAEDAGLTIEGKPGVGVGGWKSDDSGKYYLDRVFDVVVSGPKPAVRWFGAAMMTGLPKEEQILFTYRGAGAKLEDHVGSISVSGMTREQMEEWSTALSDAFPGWQISAQPKTVKGQKLFDIEIFSGAKAAFGGSGHDLEAQMTALGERIQRDGHVVKFNGIEPAEMEFLERADVDGVVRGGPRGATVVPARGVGADRSTQGGPEAAGGLRAADGSQANRGGQEAALGIDPNRGPPSEGVGREAAGGSGVVSSRFPGLRADAFNAAQGGVLGAVSEDMQAQAEGRESDPAERLRRGVTGAGLAVAGGRAARRGLPGQRLGSGVVPEGGRPNTHRGAFEAAQAKVQAITPRLQEAASRLERAEDAGSSADLKVANRVYSGVRREYDAAVDQLEAARTRLQAFDDERAQAGYGRPMEQADVMPGAAASEREGVSPYRERPSEVPVTRDDTPRTPSLNAGMPFDPASAAAGGAAGALSPDEEGEQGDPLRTGAGMALAAMGGTPAGRRVLRSAAARAKKAAAPPNLLELMQGFRFSWGMLGNFSTGAVNAMGAPIEIGLGLPSEAFRMGVLHQRPAAAIYQGVEMAAGLREGVRNMLSTVIGQIPDAVRNSPDFRPPLHERMQGAAGKAVGHAIEAPGRLTSQVPDAFWAPIMNRWGRAVEAGNMMAEGGASRLRPDEQIKEMHRLLHNPTPDEAARIEAGAKKWQEEMQYKGEAGYIEGQINNLVRGSTDRIATSADPVAKQVHEAIGSFAMPFFGTMWKLHKLSASRVPVTNFITNRSLPLDQKVSRGVVGAAIGLYIADRAAQGLVTGPGPSDPDEAALVNKDMPPYSSYVNGVGWVPNDWFGSAGPYLNAAGGYYDARRYATDKEKADADKMAERTAKDMLRAFERFPVAQALQNFITMAESPTKGVTDAIAGTASSLVPALIKTYLGSQDPMMRTTDRDAGFGGQLAQKTQARTGIGRQSLPVAQDRFGRDVQNERQGLAAWGLNVKQAQNDPIVKEFREAGVEPPRPPSDLTVSGVQVPINAREQRAWQKYMGEFLLAESKRSVAAPFWQRANKGAREDELKALSAAASEHAKGRLIDSMGKDFDRRLNEAMTRQRGLRGELAPAGR